MHFTLPPLLLSLAGAGTAAAQAEPPAPSASPTPAPPAIPVPTPSETPPPGAPDTGAQADDPDQPHPTEVPTEVPPPRRRRPEGRPGRAGADETHARDGVAVLDSGLAVEVHLANAYAPLDDQGATLPGFEGGLFLGYKAGRGLFGLGFDYLSFTMTESTSGGGSMSRSSRQIVFAPGARFALARSQDGRVDLFAELDVGFGSISSDLDGSNATTDRLVWNAGLGLRGWILPQLAIGGAGLLRSTSWSQSQFGAKQDLTLKHMVGAFQVLGVF